MNDSTDTTPATDGDVFVNRVMLCASLVGALASVFVTQTLWWFEQWTVALTVAAMASFLVALSRCVAMEQAGREPGKRVSTLAIGFVALGIVLLMAAAILDTWLETEDLPGFLRSGSTFF